MRFGIMRTAMSLAAAFFITGCPKPNTDSSSSGGSGQPGVGAHVVRGKEKRSLENDIRQLATFLYDADAGRTPRSWEEFKPQLRQAQHIVRAVEDKEIAILWNTPLGSNSVIAYETQPDLRGTHVVAWGDGRTTTVPTADLDRALAVMGQKRQAP